MVQLFAHFNIDTGVAEGKHNIHYRIVSYNVPGVLCWVEWKTVNTEKEEEEENTYTMAPSTNSLNASHLSSALFAFSTKWFEIFSLNPSVLKKAY